MRNWIKQIEEFFGTLIASPIDPEDKRTFNGTIYEYVAKFPLQEAFEDLLSTKEDEIISFECDHIDGECFTYFSTQELPPFEED